MKPKILFLLALAAVCAFRAPEAAAAGKPRVVATSANFAAIAREVAGGEAKEIYAIASPKRNIHFIQPTPKDVLKVRKADAFIHSGVDLEIWRGPLVDAAGNEKVQGQGEASISVSEGIEMLEVPLVLSRAEGDIHIHGNPHFALDPMNAKIIARNIAEGLGRIAPEHAPSFKENAEKFSRRLDEKMPEWEAALAPYKGKGIVTYHKCWVYFARHFGLEEVGYIEPKPGIPPTPRHVQQLVETMKQKNTKAVVKQVYNEGRTPEKVAKEAGARVITMAQEAGEIKGTDDYISMMDENVRLLAEALGGS